MEAQENSQTEQNVQTPKKRELALCIAQYLYQGESAAVDLLCLRVLGGRYCHLIFDLYHVLGASRL